MSERLTTHQKAKAYRAITDRYYLRHAQRDALDALDIDRFRAIRQAAHEGRWVTVEKLLCAAGIIHSEVFE